MFGRKKEERAVRPRKREGNLSKYGLLDIPGIDDSGFGVNLGDGMEDDALEAELLALTSGTTHVQQNKKPVGQSLNLDSMINESMKDISSDDDVSVDENDSTLLNELNDLVDDDDDDSNANETNHFSQGLPEYEIKSPEKNILTLLNDRLKMYEEAERNAKSSGEMVRARRLTRGVKTLNEMIKKVSAGRPVQEEEIPPPVVTTIRQKSDETSNVPTENLSLQPSLPSLTSSAENENENVTMSDDCPVKPQQEDSNSFGNTNVSDGSEITIASSSVPVNSDVLEILKARRNAFKDAALAAKRQGDSEKALRYVRVVKQFEPVIAAASTGQPVDLDSIPPPPEEYDLHISALSKGSGKAESELQKTSDPAVDMIAETAEMMAAAAAAAAAEENSGAADNPGVEAPPAPTTVLEALEQRLAKYLSAEQAAKDEGNASKARRLGRIVKQYQSAIKAHKAGKPIPVDELPTPPGFGPIPVEGTAVPLAPSVDKRPPALPPVADGSSSANTSPPSAPNIPPTTQNTTNPDDSGQSASAAKPNVNRTRQEKQLSILLSRQKKFRDAAIEAKRKGEINQAKEYLRITKGFDPLIEACRSGLPIDSSSLPVPPESKKELESDFDIVTLDDCLPTSDTNIYEKLEEDLLKQTKMCLTTRDHFKATGDIASANRFEQLAVNSKKDLDAVKYAHKRNDTIPKFHYETRTFSIVQCCTELGDNDLELSVLQGINYNVPNPKEIDTYVRFEFPYPTETPAKDRTGLIKNTNNPQYNQTFLLPIQRNVRACQRVFKRHAIKLEVWSRGGFFRGDSLIGSASVKLMPLETKCILHDAFDLMDGRKAIGGKLEVKVRVRHPILTKQVEKVQEKWLVIDQYF